MASHGAVNRALRAIVRRQRTELQSRAIEPDDLLAKLGHHAATSAPAGREQPQG